MNVLQNFQDDFTELVRVTYNTYWDLPVYPKKKFSTVLQTFLIEILKGRELTFDLTKEDLEQELSLLWLSYYKQYTSATSKPDTSLKNYILRRSLWDIRDWIKHHLNIVTVHSVDPEPANGIGFKIDLMFLLKGTEINLLKNLSPYERYLIFLKFKEEKSILQMSYILQKDRRVVKNHFDLVINKIKENHSNGISS